MFLDNNIKIYCFAFYSERLIRGGYSLLIGRIHRKKPSRFCVKADQLHPARSGMIFEGCFSSENFLGWSRPSADRTTRKFSTFKKLFQAPSSKIVSPTFRYRRKQLRKCPRTYMIRRKQLQKCPRIGRADRSRLVWLGQVTNKKKSKFNYIF